MQSSSSVILEDLRKSIQKLLSTRKPYLSPQQLVILTDQYIILAASEIDKIAETPRRYSLRRRVIKINHTTRTYRRETRTFRDAKTSEGAIHDIQEDVTRVGEDVASYSSEDNITACGEFSCHKKNSIKSSPENMDNFQVLLLACEYVQAQERCNGQ